MKIIHLSDLHFGTEIPGGADALRKDIQKHNPDLIIVSGDFTQIANSAEFAAASAFLKSLQFPVFSVPGNHDIPRHHLNERFFNPYKKYKRFINPDLSPTHTSGDICIAGINTARRILPHWNWANGAISHAQLDWLNDVFTGSGARIRICVMHHPIHKAEGNPLKTVVFGATQALETIKKLKVDLVLTGHVHHASITTIDNDGHKTVFLSASTALSKRQRTQTHGYNVITFENQGFTIDIYLHKNDGFTCSQQYISH